MTGEVTVTETPKELLAYLAGTIDADGFITIHKQLIANRHPDKRKGRIRDYYTPIIGLSEVHPVIPKLLAETFGGNARQYVYHTRPNNRVPWCWQLTNRKAIQTAKILMPYLRLKRRNAEVLVEYEHSTEVGPEVSEEERLRREKLCLLIRSFNTQRKSDAKAKYEVGYKGPSLEELIQERTRRDHGRAILDGRTWVEVPQ